MLIGKDEGVTRTPCIIGIDGRSGSGKTTLAAGLCGDLAHAGVHARILHMDDLYPGWEGLSAAVAVLADEVLTPLRSGRPGRFRRFDWLTMAYAEEQEIGALDVLVVEGCGSTAGRAGLLVDLRVWMTAAATTRRRRALDRDHGDFAPYWRMWADQEDAVFGAGRTEQLADLVVVTDTE